MIPVIFHNSKGYDSHLIMQCFTRYATEKFHSFPIGILRLVYRLPLLTASLDTLVQSLAADRKDKFILTARHYPDSDLGSTKGNYLYEYVDGRDKLKLTTLPSIDAFYSSLTEETITLVEYERDQKV